MIAAGVFLDADQARAHLGAAKSEKTDHANRFDLDRVIADGMPVRLRGADGETVAAYVVQPFGSALWITAAAGSAAFPLCPLIDRHASAQARAAGFDAVAFRTERRGLVRRCERLGYIVTKTDGRTFYMRKTLK